MNLADAIRQASRSPHSFVIREERAEGVGETPTIEFEIDTTLMNADLDAKHDDEVVHSNAVPAHGSVVRLELYLSPEQMSSLFRHVLAGQHTLLTLREAANYLRIGPGSLELLAAQGSIPAFQVDGKWRFAKQGIDEWLQTQHNRGEAVSDHV